MTNFTQSVLEEVRTLGLGTKQACAHGILTNANSLKSFSENFTVSEFQELIDNMTDAIAERKIKEENDKIMQTYRALISLEMPVPEELMAKVNEIDAAKDSKSTGRKSVKAGKEAYGAFAVVVDGEEKIFMVFRLIGSLTWFDCEASQRFARL